MPTTPVCVSFSSHSIFLLFCEIPLFLRMQEQSCTPPYIACQRVTVRREPFILKRELLVLVVTVLSVNESTH